jgi:hypothetical protein
MFRTKLLPAGLLAAIVAVAASPDGRCAPGSDRPAPSGPKGGSEWKLDDLRWDPAISGKLREIEELNQKIEQVRKLVVPKIFERQSKPYREKIEALQKEVDEYVRSVNQAAGASGRPNSAELLTPQRFAQLEKLIRPAPGESRWEEIPWLLNVYEARKKAAEEGKPIFLWSAGGGPPIGGC